MTLEELKVFIRENFTEDDVPEHMHSLVEYAAEHEQTDEASSEEVERLQNEITRLKRDNLRALFSSAAARAVEEQVQEEEEEEEEEEKKRAKTFEELIEEGVEY